MIFRLQIKPSEGYLLDDTVHAVGADPKLYTVEHNLTSNDVTEEVIKGNIALIKHTDDGETQIETPEEGATFEIYLKSAGSFEAGDANERDTIVCDENGFGQTKDMPYGVYTVHQTSGWEGRELMKDFDVFIAQDEATYRYLMNNANFEFKSAVKENTTIMDAYRQLTVRYRRDIPEIFKYNAFVVISDGANNKYGSFFSPYDFFYAWRKVNSDDKELDGLNSLVTMIKGLFRKDRLLDVIKDFVYFPDNSDSDLKIVCRYPQFFAANKLFENIKAHMRPTGDGKGGTYFGATGCGKSYTIRACYIDVVFSLRVQAVDCQLKLGTHLNLVYKQVVRFAFLIMFFHIGV